MKIDPDSWHILSRVLDQWLGLPENFRGARLESLGPEYPKLRVGARQMIAAQKGIDAEAFWTRRTG